VFSTNVDLSARFPMTGLCETSGAAGGGGDEDEDEACSGAAAAHGALTGLLSSTGHEVTISM
jgi:hypothetical protein